MLHSFGMASAWRGMLQDATAWKFDWQSVGIFDYAHIRLSFGALKSANENVIMVSNYQFSFKFCIKE